MPRLDKIRQHLAAEPNDVLLNYTLAMELSKLGMIAEGREAFARVRQLDLNYVPAYFQEGQMLAGAGQVEAAREILQRGITVARQVRDDHALREMTEFLDGLA